MTSHVTTDSTSPITHALSAVAEHADGRTPAAQRHLDAAQRASQCLARRHRQIIEIAGLVVAGARERAAGLTLVHTAQFPEDGDLLARVTGTHATPEGATNEGSASPLDRVTWPLRTPRLAIRPATAADTEATWSFRRLDSVSQWLTRAPRTVDEHRTQFEDAASLRKTLVIELDGLVIGDLMLAIEDAWSQAEITGGEQLHAELGWVLHPNYTGHGYATESVRAVLRVCFEDLGLRRVTADCFADNESSWRLMERVGMRREGHAVRDALHRSGQWMDTFTYALLDDEWRERSRRTT